ncbi:MAG: YbaB/EbfC family nucleoid-associated protein [Weeksellaceae bacterium]|jgi:DNA-binding YbaB/EbfC family protein|nr:YbaB/EbfC family nucleoid-associated protein [Weeksellaceae bacterium]MDX9704822.1 YbaB/EbfC family nucleoid-associated protein [Weeksellaceae bacterium]
MFGNIMEMMGKLQAIQGKFQELKEKLDNQSFTETSADGTISITITELATIKDIQISDESLFDKTQLEDNLVVTLNKALEKIKINAIEQAKITAKDNLPPIPGLGL